MRAALIITLLCVTAGSILLLEGRAGSTAMHFRVSTSPADVHVADSPRGDVIEVAGPDRRAFTPLADAGRPALPMRVVNVILPAGHGVASVRAGAVSAAVVSRDVRPALAEASRPSPDAGAPPVLPARGDGSLAPADDGAAFPSAFVRHLGTGAWHGHRIASFAVFPVRVEQGDLVVYPDVDVTIELEPVTDQTAVRARRMGPSALAGMRSEVERTVVNPADLDGYPHIDPRAEGPFDPSAVPSLEGSPVEYIIITSDALAPTYEPFAEWKTAKGVPTVVRTVDWILANYRRGSDTAETIRFFLQDAYAKWGVKYVLIGGDIQDVPVRLLYSTHYYGGTLIPSDLYYGALDGDFNADHDDLYGEQPADAPDLWPELHVGRLPMSSVADVQAVLNKIVTYESAPDSAYTDKVLFLAEVLFPTPWSPPQTITLNGADIANFVGALYVDAPERRVTRMFETPAYYTGAVQESRQLALDSLQAGYNHVFHVGHGYRFNMHCADDNIAIPDADAMSNWTRPFNLYMLNCTAAAFDFDCLAEHLLRNPWGGAVSVVGASNSTFADATAGYMSSYAEAVFKQDIVHIGEALTASRTKRTPYAMLGDNVDLWTHYIYTALADPEMALWTETVLQATVTVPPTVIAGTGDIAVNVSTDGSPVDSATVCLSKAGEDYEVQTTDASGNALIPFTTATAGTIQVVVSGRNIVRREASIDVIASALPLLAFEGLTVDDDAIGGTVGNGDGRLDAGETIDLVPSIRNTGGAAALLASLQLASASPHITILDAVASLDPLAAGGLAAAGDAWRIELANTTPDGATIRFDVAMIDTGHSWTDGFAQVAHAPAVEVTRLRKSDQAPAGDGNGIITAGEQFYLYCAAKNYGSGRADGLTAVLRAGDAGSMVIDSLSSYPALAALTESENSVAFRLSEADVTIANPLELVLTDSHGRVLVHPLDLREPLATTIQVFDASVGVDKMSVTWSASASPDAAGYRVFRSTSMGGPFVAATPDIVRHTVFVDFGLAPSTRYYYAITALDSSGNESAWSPVASSSTNPPQLLGWPNVMADVSSNSPVIGDIDSDGRAEVIVGNDYLYAWNDNGQEVVDGDGEPLTWGVFSPLGQGFIGPAALARLDNIPGLDIVAAAYTSREVYVFHGTGGVFAGWPRPTIDQVRASVVVGDVDGDGNFDIVAVDQDAYLYAWHIDGNELIDGDSNPATDGVFKRLPDTNQWQYQAPALADIDNDGKDEIIIAAQDKKLYVFNHDGSDVAGWPRTLPNYPGGGVAVGDIDQNGTLEIVVTVRSSGETYALYNDNTVMWTRWLQHNLFFNPSPALADITGDGQLEVIVPATNGKLHAIQYNGSDAPGWPVTYSTTTYTESSPVVADVDGDGILDVLLGDEGKFINGWSATGVPLDGFPLVTKDSVRGTPAIGDLELDGDIEILVAGYDRTVYVWDLPGSYDPNKAPWPMYHANSYHNALHGFETSTAVGETPRRALSFRLGQNYPNPFNPRTTIEFELAGGDSRPVTLTVYDVTGARVRTLLKQPMTGGRRSVSWDGRNDSGVAVGSGVYFYRLTEPGRALTRKMVLLK